MEIEKKIRDFVAKNILFSGKDFPFPDTASFLEEGIVDSQGVMELVLFVEETFHIEVKDHEIVPDHFDSVQLLADYVRQKQ